MNQQFVALRFDADLGERAFLLNKKGDVTFCLCTYLFTAAARFDGFIWPLLFSATDTNLQTW